jgi:hypothetical protein
MKWIFININIKIIKKMQTPPLNTKNLVLMLKNDFEKLNGTIINFLDNEGFFDFDDNEVIKYLENYGKYYNLNLNDLDNLDYLNLFLRQNYNNLKNNNYNYQDYIEPKLKSFIIQGSESYGASVNDYYRLDFQGYTQEYVRFLIDNYDISLSDGEFIQQDFTDTWDVEQIIESIEEVDSIVTESQNENHEKVGHTISSNDFLSYVEDEYDIEMIDILIQVLQKRKKFLETMFNTLNPRKRIDGFKRFD